MKNVRSPTSETYLALDAALDALRPLLPPSQSKVLVTFDRTHGVSAVYRRQFRSIEGENVFADEFVIHPTYLAVMSPQRKLVEVGHLMLHQWQAEHGKPARSAWQHNQEFVGKALEIGLRSSSPDGKPTGPRIEHTVVEGGLFDVTTGPLLATGWDVPFVERTARDLQSAEEPTSAAARAKATKAASKTLYTCPNCKTAKVWGKRDLRIAHVPCRTEFTTSTISIDAAAQRGGSESQS